MDDPPVVRRVAILSLHSSPLAVLGSTDAGGMNLYVGRLADNLRSRGIAVDVFTRRTESDTPEIVRRASGARVVHLTAGPARPLHKSALLHHLPAMVAALEAYMHRERACYDLVHSHYWLSGVVALRAPSLHHCPRLHMFHTLSRVKELYFGRPDPTDSTLRFAGEREVIVGMDAIVGATEAEREQIERLYRVSPRRYAVIPPGVDLETFQSYPAEESRRALGIDGDQVVLFVGRLDPIKGLDILMRSIAEIARDTTRRPRLVVVGDPESDHRGGLSRYRRMAQRLGIPDLVEFRGSVAQEELARYYSAADVCAVPSTYESFGMVALESMACETPVVAFRVGGLATTVRDGDTGFLARSGDVDEYTRVLHAALCSDKLETMGRRARASVQHYSWDVIVDRTHALYRDLVRQRSRRPALTHAS